MNSWNKLFSQSMVNWKGTYFQEWPKGEGNRQKAAENFLKKPEAQDWPSSRIG